MLLNTDGFVVEGASSNLFWVDGDTICTPPLASGILPGVTRGVVLEIYEKLGLKIREANIGAEELKRADGIFVSLSSFGFAEAVSIDDEACRRSPVPARLFRAYWELLARV